MLVFTEMLLIPSTAFLLGKTQIGWVDGSLIRGFSLSYSNTPVLGFFKVFLEILARIAGRIRTRRLAKNHMFRSYYVPIHHALVMLYK